jgi:hypothetical protein
MGRERQEQLSGHKPYTQPLTPEEAAILLEACESLNKWIEEHKDAIRIAEKELYFTPREQHKNVTTSDYDWSGSAYEDFGPDNVDRQRRYHAENEVRREKNKKKRMMKRRFHPVQS